MVRVKHNSDNENLEKKIEVVDRKNTGYYWLGKKKLIMSKKLQSLK